MNVLQSIGVAILGITAILSFLALAFFAVYALCIILPHPTIIVGMDAEVAKEQRKQHPLLYETTASITTLALWYINIPLWLYGRYIKKNEKVTFFHPRGKW